MPLEISDEGDNTDALDLGVDRWVTARPAGREGLPVVRLYVDGTVGHPRARRAVAAARWVRPIPSESRPSRPPSPPLSIYLSVPVTDRKPGRVARTLTSVALRAAVSPLDGLPRWVGAAELRGAVPADLGDGAHLAGHGLLHLACLVRPSVASLSLCSAPLLAPYYSLRPFRSFLSSLPLGRSRSVPPSFACLVWCSTVMQLLHPVVLPATAQSTCYSAFLLTRFLVSIFKKLFFLKKK